MKKLFGEKIWLKSHFAEKHERTGIVMPVLSLGTCFFSSFFFTVLAVLHFGFSTIWQFSTQDFYQKVFSPFWQFSIFFTQKIFIKNIFTQKIFILFFTQIFFTVLAVLHFFHLKRFSPKRFSLKIFSSFFFHSNFFTIPRSPFFFTKKFFHPFFSP